MKKFAKYLLTLGIAALSFAACEDEPLVEPVKYTIGGDSTFKDFQATVKVTADKAADVDVTVDIKLDATSTFTAEMLSFPATVKVAKGDTEASATVKITNPNALRPGEYKAVFSAAIEGVDLAEKVTITFSKADLSGQWSVIGSFAASDWKNDVAMTAGEGGWYAVEGVEIAAGDAFKFRRDGDWAVAFGLEATAVVPLDQEFDVTTKGGENTDIKIENEGIYTISLNPNAAKAKVSRTGDLVKTLTLAQLAALMPAENNATADFKGVLNDVIVTYVAGSNVFLEDATGAILLYLKNSGLAAGVTLSGYFEGKVQNYNNLPEISELKFNQEEITFGTAEVPAPAEMTIAEVLANFDNLISKRVKIVNAYAGADIQKKGGYSIYQGENSIPFYVNVDLKKGFKAGSLLDVIAIVTPYKEVKQLKIFEEAAIIKLTPVMTMSDILALCTSTTDANFAGLFKGLYVNYIYSTRHVYIEDETGGIRYYAPADHTLKVGDKISGLITGICSLDKNNDTTRPVISWLDTSSGKVEAAPAEEMPQPVTGTIASFKENKNALLYHRVYLEDVVLENDLKNGVNTISDATGSMQLNVRFTPSISVPKGSKVSGYGTFDLNYGTFEIRVFNQSEVTKVTPPAEPKLTVERVWGKYPGTWSGVYMGANEDRTMATDGDYIYIAKAGDSVSGIVAISIADPSVTKEVNITGVDGGFFKTSCVRTIFNPANNKYILLASSLAHSTDCNFNVYAWMDGIDNAPTKVISWNTNNGSARRIGDFFTVVGDCANGEIWARINNGTDKLSTTFVWKITNGTVGGVLGGSIGYGGSSGMGSVYKYSIDAPQVMVVTPEIGRFFKCTVESTWINADSAGIDWTNGDDNSVWGKKFGYTPFTFKGKKYIAYLNMYNAARGWVTIIEDTQGTAEGFMQTLIDNSIVYQGAIQIEKDEPSTEVMANPTYSGNTMANCAVVVKDDHVIIVGHQQNTGLSVFKMYMK